MLLFWGSIKLYCILISSSRAPTLACGFTITPAETKLCTAMKVAQLKWHDVLFPLLNLILSHSQSCTYTDIVIKSQTGLFSCLNEPEFFACGSPNNSCFSFSCALNPVKARDVFLFFFSFFFFNHTSSQFMHAPVIWTDGKSHLAMQAEHKKCTVGLHSNRCQWYVCQKEQEEKV